MGQALLTALGMPLLGVVFCCLTRISCYGVLRMDLVPEHRDRMWVFTAIVSGQLAGLTRMMVAGIDNLAIQAATSILAGAVEIFSRATLVYRDRLVYALLTWLSCTNQSTNQVNIIAPTLSPSQGV